MPRKPTRNHQANSADDPGHFKFTDAEIRAATTRRVTCPNCRLAFDSVSPILAMVGHDVPDGAEPDGFQFTIPCPVCGYFLKEHGPSSVVLGEGRTVTAVTAGALAIALKSLAQELQSGKTTTEAAADRLERTPLLASFGRWLKQNSVSLSLGIAALSLILQAVAAVQPDTTMTPDQIEEIISRVLDEVNDDAPSSSDTIAPDPVEP